MKWELHDHEPFLEWLSVHIAFDFSANPQGGTTQVTVKKKRRLDKPDVDE